MKRNALPWSPDLYRELLRFAGIAHGDQKVPGTAIPYLFHVSNVCMEVMTALHAEQHGDGDLAVACALLHDVVEDTGVPIEEIRKRFGREVARGVLALTKDKEIPKEGRMGDSLSRILREPEEVGMVKMADRIVNLERPPSHWTREKTRGYREEARLILKELKGCSGFLAGRLSRKIRAYGKFMEE